MPLNNLVQTAGTLLRQNNINEAEKLFLQAVSACPDDCNVLNGLAETALARKSYDEARDRFFAFMAKHPDSPIAAIGFLKSLLLLNRFQEAEDHYLQSIDRFPGNFDVLQAFSTALTTILNHDAIIEFSLSSIRAIRNAGLKPALVIGNCMSKPLTAILTTSPAFSSTYGFVHSAADIYIMPPELQQMFLEQVVPAVDLVLMQNIGAYYSLNTNDVKSRNTGVVTFPTCYFLGYYPDMIYLTKNGKSIPNYSSAFIVKAYSEGLTAQECNKQYLSGEWIGDKLLTSIEEMHEELFRREQCLDIKMLDFHKRTYQTNVLYHTHNHPSIRLLHHIADNTLLRLGLPVLPDNIEDWGIDFLNATQWIIPKNIGRLLRLPETLWRSEFVINKKPFSTMGYVDTIYHMLQHDNELIAENMPRIEKHLSPFL